MGMKRVVVIGAGPAGLAALRSLLGYKDKLQFIAYETSDRVGGTWNFDDPYKPTSMYNNLKTNTAKENMVYPGFPFPTEIYESFVGRKEVLEYLESFTQHYKLHEYIKFRHRVVEVDPVMNEVDETRWNVTVEDCESESISTNQFDFVLVCNGQHSVPLILNIEGQDTYTGEIVHSITYRTPWKYKDKTVLVLGGGPSGIDISADLSLQASKVYLSHSNERFNYADIDIVEVAGVDKIAGDDIVLKDGTIVHADVILLATGYRYSFPFLSKKCHPVLEADGTLISNIYKLLVDINYPSLFYIGLNKRVLPFPQFSYQCDYAVACITGQIKPVSREVMEQDYKERRERFSKEFDQLHLFHIKEPHEWTYFNQLAADSKMPKIPANVENLTLHIEMMRMKHAIRYKDAVYRLSEDGQSFNIISEPKLTSS